MKKQIYLAILCLIFSLNSNAQKEASNWYFGFNAGVRFNADNSVDATTNGQINVLEGCTSISDPDGNLLFYSDGRTVWDRQHQAMSNANYNGGTGLHGDPSSTSSGLIVPKPQDPTKYYLFTVDEPHHDNAAVYPNQNTSVGANADDGFNNGFNYTLIDMNLNNGFGDADTNEKNQHLITYDTNPNGEEIKYKCSEKITAVKADDCSSFWVITHFTNTFYAFKVDENGVNETPTPSIFLNQELIVPVSGYRRNAIGYIKASPDGTKLVIAHYGFATNTGATAPGAVQLFDFDSNTGTVSNPVILYNPNTAGNNGNPYGVEFSADNKKVYATVGTGNSSQIFQWNLEVGNIPSTMREIHQSNTISAGALQLGLDGKIYRAQYNFNSNNGSHLGIIENPEADANLETVNYLEQGVFLNGRNGGIGLPPFIQSLFNSEVDIIQNGISTTDLSLCTGDVYTLTAQDITGADYVWSKDGVPLTETTFELIINTPGIYEVYIEPNNGECPIEGAANVGIYDIPVANPTTDITVCDDNSNDGIDSFDFTTKNADILLAQDAAQYNVRYFETLDNANDLQNEITFPYQNTSNPQTIFARIDNVDNTNCFDVTNFEIEISYTPTIVVVSDVEYCDNQGDPFDGVSNTDLSALTSSIIGTQDASQIGVTFHPSQTDADDNTNPLALNYTNTTPIETIFVRIENTINTTCYNTDSFTLTINPAPTANNISLIQCDEDGIPEGFTTFNLSESVNEITNSEGSSVEFYLSAIDAQNQTNSLQSNIFENFFNPQILYTRVTNSNGCVSFSELSLEVSVTSSRDAALAFCDTDGTEDGFFSFNLADTDDVLLANSPAGLDISYYETYLDALIEVNPLNSTYTNTTAYQQTIFARLENTNACFGISEISLTVYKLPNIETTSETLYCLNSNEQLTLHGGVINDIPNNYLYQWSTGEDTAEIMVDTPGTYTVRVTNTNGCSKDRTITIVPSNIATITNIEVVDVSQDNSITVFVTGEGDYEFSIDGVNYQDSPTFNGVKPGFYSVYVRDKNNCGIVEDMISVVGFPKFFTPNGDTVNDFWQVKGISASFQANTSILIFDKYGKLLKQLNPLSSGWDGTLNGKNMPTSDYWFIVTLEDGRTFKSHFSLKR